MTYSKLFNIKLTNNNTYKIKINKLFKFRFITPENLNGIKLETFSKENINLDTINNNEATHLNWYIYNSNIDFSPLNKYKYLVLQLYSDKEYSIEVLEKNDTFIITNENKWYYCNNMGPTCGLEFYNLIINKKKPVQEINECLKYKISGNAKIIKNKYIKSGTEESNVVVTGFKNNVINYISDFVLDKLIKNNNKSININKKISTLNNFPYLDQLTSNTNIENEDLNSVNNKIEMIKFQLKNYFIENNNELTKISCNINNQKEKNDDNTEKIGILDLRLTDQDLNFKNCSLKLDELNLNLENTRDKLNTSDSLINKNINNLENKINENNTEFIANNTEITNKLNTHINKYLDDVNTINKNNELIKETTIKNSNDIINLNSINNDNNEKLDKLDFKIDDINSSFNYHLLDFNKRFSKLILDLNNIKGSVDSKVEETILKITSDHIKITEQVNDYIQKQSNDIKLISDNNNSIKEETNKMKEETNKMKEQLLKNNAYLEKILDEELSKVLIKYENKCKNKLDNLIETYDFKNIWNNKNNTIYDIDCHSTNVTIQFMKINNTYKSQRFYLLKDVYKGKIVPYYCWYVKEYKNDLSTAKLIPLIPLTSIYF